MTSTHPNPTAGLPEPASARVGCSGWSYRAWKGSFYPADLPVRRWFDWYAAVFDAVELNNTFYRLPSTDAVERWRDAAPPGFVYALKLGAFGTHRKKLRDAASWLPHHVERAALLGDHLGPTLVQMPPNWACNAARLDEMLSAAPGDLKWAVEFRDRSWLTDNVFQILERHGAALCVHDLINDHPWLLTTTWTYVRCHGPHATTQPYRDRYGPERLETLASRLEQWLAGGVAIHCYFNNDDRAFATSDASWLRARLSQLPFRSASD